VFALIGGSQSTAALTPAGWKIGLTAVAAIAIITRADTQLVRLGREQRRTVRQFRCPSVALNVILLP
jgi:hypothetical protein